MSALVFSAAMLVWGLALPPQAPASPPESNEYQVGAGDVLDIVVIGSDDLSRSATVQPNGMIRLQLLGEVPVSGLTVTEIQRKLTTLLERDYLVDPEVEVRVKEYQSQFVIVLGEVNSPGRKVLRGRTRLMDLLIDAGGFKPSASGEVTISRTEGSFDGGTDTLKLRIGSGGPSPQDRVNLEVILKNGDLISVSGKSHVTVEGEVNRPSRYAIEGDLTVTGAIFLAGGLTRFGSNDVKLRRTDPETGKVEILNVDLKAIRNGKKPDIPVLANDVITVPRRRF
jgi:polysaccharide export outer membrane protein